MPIVYLYYIMPIVLWLYDVAVNVARKSNPKKRNYFTIRAVLKKPWFVGIFVSGNSLKLTKLRRKGFENWSHVLEFSWVFRFIEIWFIKKLQFHLYSLMKHWPMTVSRWVITIIYSGLHRHGYYTPFAVDMHIIIMSYFVSLDKWISYPKGRKGHSIRLLNSWLPVEIIQISSSHPEIGTLSPHYLV